MPLQLPRSPWLTEELDDFREMARSFCQKELTPHQDRWIENKQIDREVWTKAGEIGLLCLSVPEEYGGGGGSFAHETVLYEEQARSGDSAWGVSVHNGIVAHYLLAYAAEEKKREWLPKLASGEWIGAIAMTEPGTGSDLQGITTRAVRDGDEYVINGAKTFITNGAMADFVVVACKTDPDPDAGAKGMSLIAVPTSAAGFRRGRVLDKIGLKGQDTAELFFDDVRVPVANLLGDQEGLGFFQLMQQLPQERLLIAVTAVAGMEAAVDQTIAYTHEREAFGRPLSKFQNTKFTLADAATEVAVSRAFLDQCIERHLRGDLDVQGAAMAKLWTTERANRVIDDCVQLFGGYGYMMEYPVARAWADMRISRIFGGTSEIMKDIISRTL
ncbi:MULTISPECIES: acyl-CoA dehydrogenase family protein [Prauserella salsuginis group]|uniref:Acyl-CoA dehydrogenase n=2 Tax=Prauserella salsuginis group TaxID=2893672 RepID=A0A839XZ70_9PSEU|nr:MULTISPECIES: acyl-CoA dehydrogenase family protein [Prauserella salsuginis group]MBB3665015.1 acyl-CoA dehydrogenase [Prauserella sediminis]MCR3718486.1 acyl-CoA dehydrogenase [Prauserella flava]MCR3733056.1 acyl-CoA dehydrogenase [Prauserella salsuginis]